MLLQILFNGSIGTETKLAIIIPYIISVLIIIFLILPIHELAHGWVACKLGDNTAKRDGRLTPQSPAQHQPDWLLVPAAVWGLAGRVRWRSIPAILSIPGSAWRSLPWPAPCPT